VHPQNKIMQTLIHRINSSSIKNQLRFLVLIIFSCFANVGYAQTTNACECKTNQAVTVCYLRTADFCYDRNRCSYTLDGEFMESALTRKLESAANFGSNGVVDCDIQLKPLRDYTSVTAIEDCGCDIVFTGSFPVDTLTTTIDSEVSSVPFPVLRTIREWSLKCSYNLVIVSQKEAAPWGYTIENENRNPNTPLSGNSLSSIFDGPFGKISEFQQGGTFQGVITAMPDTGGEILASDRDNQPTVVLDTETNDLILGDIGILSGNGAGRISSGRSISNDNDILAANIFALGCRIAEGEVSSYTLEEVCPGTLITLFSGREVNNEGIYTDTTEAANGCDSIIVTEIKHTGTSETEITHNGCMGDGYSVTFNGTVYNEENTIGIEMIENVAGCDSIVTVNLQFFPKSSTDIIEDVCDSYSLSINNTVYDSSNPSGQELLVNRAGCDSLVTIDLRFSSNSETFINDVSCRGSGYSISLNNRIYNEANPSGQEVLQNTSGCDSTIFVDLVFNSADSIFEEFLICTGESMFVNGQEYFAGESDRVVYERAGQCDSIYFFSVTTEAMSITIDSSITRMVGGEGQFNNSIPDNFQIQWLPATGLSCSDCENPRIIGAEYIPSYDLVITDPTGCIFEYTVAVTYNIEPYIPNAFSPNNDGINDQFQIFPGIQSSAAQINQFLVFNRWGSLVYEQKDIDLRNDNAWWDGSFNGQALKQGVYVYFIEMTFDNGEVVKLEGDVVIMP